METNGAVSGLKESFVVCRDSSGAETRGTLVRLTRDLAVFEIYSPTVVLRMSEVLAEFKITFQDRLIYSGRAVVSSLVNSGTGLVCEASLDEGWLELSAVLPGGKNPLPAQFGEFLKSWQHNYRVRPEFKVVVADMESLFADMRLWLDQVELSLRSTSSGDRIQREREAAHELAASVLPAIDSIGDQFEEIAAGLDADARPAHIRFARRQLHPLVLCSPFAFRTYRKPLGYAGDYEMVNMIVRNPYEGGSLFAKVVNAWFLDQLPALAHRNRITILKQRLKAETARAMRLGRPAKIFNLGCGPAGEIQEFIKEEIVASSARFDLLDFNEETIQHTGALLRELARKNNRTTGIQMLQKSVAQVLKEAARASAGTANGSTGKYDFLYCAGLFDYLPDRVCKQLMNVFYESVAPGGLLLVTNVDATLAFRNKLEFILDWNLLYRNHRQMTALKPDQALADDCSVLADASAVNLFLEIRKPENA